MTMTFLNSLNRNLTIFLEKKIEKNYAQKRMRK